MDFLSNGGMLAIMGYFGFLLKDIPNQILSLILPRFTSTVTWNNNSSTWVYIASNKWVFSKDKSNLLQRHIELAWDGKTEASEGTYYIRIKPLTLIKLTMYTSKDKGADNVTKFASMTIYGLKQKELVSDYKNFIDHELNDGSRDMIEVRTMSCHGISYTMTPERKAESIFSPVFPNIIKDVDKFIEDREFYISHGMPHKTGILLYGEPGTGKSTIVKAIATHIGCTINYINLAKVDITCMDLDDGQHNKSTKPTIVVFEDIDCMHSSLKRDETSGKKDNVLEAIGTDATDMSTLLNTLDGTLSPSGVIFIATTNYIDKIDDAIKRPGRFDHAYEVGPIDKDMSTKMCEYYEVDPAVALEGVEFPVRPALVQAKILAIVGGANI